MKIDYLIIICNGCARERTIDFNPLLQGAEEFDRWMKTKLTPCGCGATHCDINAHLADTGQDN